MDEELGDFEVELYVYTGVVAHGNHDIIHGYCLVDSYYEILPDIEPIYFGKALHPGRPGMVLSLRNYKNRKYSDAKYAGTKPPDPTVLEWQARHEAILKEAMILRNEITERNRNLLYESLNPLKGLYAQCTKNQRIALLAYVIEYLTK